MAIELKQSLKLTQQLMITPQLQQAIKLLQLSRAELVETVQKELLENPVLEEAAADNGLTADGIGHTERMTDLNTVIDGTPAAAQAEKSEKNDGKEFDWASFIESSHSRSYEGRNFAGNNEDLPNYENTLTRAGTLQDHLEWQIHLMDLSAQEREICETLIGNIDEDGYLRATLEELTSKTNFSLENLEDALCIIQELDPIGVGAKDLKECLLLQARQFGPEKKTLTDIINNHLTHIEKRDFLTLGKKLSVNPKRAKELAQIIYSLEPKPGRVFGGSDVQYVTPDIYVKKIGDDYVVVLNEDGLPKLQISNFYKSAIMKEMASRTDAAAVTNLKQDEAQSYIQEKLKSALWLIKSIHQRQKTLYKVTKAIVQFQKEFFEKGVQHLKPLVLRDVADDIGVHESTVSRATSGKFVHTPQGIFELKYFFNTGIASSSGGEDFANEAVKQMVRQVIGTENPKSPLSDQAIAEILKGQNINIARRTVAKYREMLGILPSSRRKRLY
jgi:RNA polymerase sigma-54 factor